MHTIKLSITKQVHTSILRLCLTRSRNNRYITYVTLLIIFRILLSFFINLTWIRVKRQPFPAYSDAVLSGLCTGTPAHAHAALAATNSTPMRQRSSGTCAHHPSALHKYPSHLGGGVHDGCIMIGRLSEMAARCRIATAEGFLSAQGSPGALTYKPILVLCPRS